MANHFGRLDILVNCVGLNREEKAGEVTEPAFDSGDWMSISKALCFKRRQRRGT